MVCLLSPWASSKIDVSSGAKEYGRRGPNISRAQYFKSSFFRIQACASRCVCVSRPRRRRGWVSFLGLDEPVGQEINAEYVGEEGVRVEENCSVYTEFRVIVFLDYFPQIRKRVGIFDFHDR